MAKKTNPPTPRVKGYSVGPESAVGPSSLYIRIPGPYGICPLTSMKRAQMLALVMPSKKNGGTPAVKSVLLKRPGAKRGSRFIRISSLLAFMRANETQGAA